MMAATGWSDASVVSRDWASKRGEGGGEIGGCGGQADHAVTR